MEFPEPVIEIAVEPKTKGDQEKMGQALARLATEDPSFRVAVDHESGQTIIKGMGELHLEIIVDRMKREFKVDANVGAPQVAYRETITRAGRDRLHPQEADRRRRASSPASRCASSRCRRARASSSRTRSSAARCRKEYVPGVEKGLQGLGRDRRARRLPGDRFQGDAVSTAPITRSIRASLAFEIAARAAFKEGVMKAAPKLLEPIMRVEVVTPDDYMGDVIGDLNSRRGQVTGMDTRGNARVIDAMVPLANMFGYVNTLRSMSQGRAQYTMHFDHYEQVPQAVADEVRAKMA